jgi:ComF family protein
VASAQTGILERLLGTLFPSRCLGCGLRGKDLCDPCRSAVPWLTADVCPSCATPSRLARICRACQTETPLLDGARVACHFEGVVRRAIHDLKYRGVVGRAPILAELVVEAVERRPLAVDLLVPVPLAASRRRQRGFNQAELIANAVAERLGWEARPKILARTRETPQQARLSAVERRANVADAFVCQEPDAVYGRRVAVLDDVMTTGSTLAACAEALRMAGARRVYGLAVAREV